MILHMMQEVKMFLGVEEGYVLVYSCLRFINYNTWLNKQVCRHFDHLSV